MDLGAPLRCFSAPRLDSLAFIARSGTQTVLRRAKNVAASLLSFFARSGTQTVRPRAKKVTGRALCVLRHLRGIPKSNVDLGERQRPKPSLKRLARSAGRQRSNAAPNAARTSDGSVFGSGSVDAMLDSAAGRTCAAISFTKQSDCADVMRPLAPCWRPSASTRAIERASAASAPDDTDALAPELCRPAGGLSSLHAATTKRHNATAATARDMRMRV